MLLVTELIANAVIHGSPDVSLDVDVDDAISVLRVQVTDGSPVLPRRVEPGGAGGGRGLSIVERLADRWDAEPVGDPVTGKSVWFEMKG